MSVRAECARVWARFAAPGAGGAGYRIEDLAPEAVEEAVGLLKEYFVRDEPPCKHIGLRNYPAALSHLETLWRSAINDRLSLVCVQDTPGNSRIVGVNILSIAKKDEKDEPFETSDPIWAMLFGAVDLVSRSVDVFEKYKTDRYLTAYGLVVHPEYRGQGIGLQLLRARIPLCRALGVGVTATVFTAAASQKVAEQAGFVTLAEISYQAMADSHGFVFPGVTESTKSSKLMALVIE